MRSQSVVAIAKEAEGGPLVFLESFDSSLLVLAEPPAWHTCPSQEILEKRSVQAEISTRQSIPEKSFFCSLTNFCVMP